MFFFIFFWQLFQGLTKDVSSVVGAPWRCGVLTTLGGIAGIRLGHLLGREHASTPQSGVEAPRLLKRSLPRLDCCCCRQGAVLHRDHRLVVGSMRMLAVWDPH